MGHTFSPLPVFQSAFQDLCNFDFMNPDIMNFSFYRKRNGGTERLNNFSSITQGVGSGTGIKIELCCGSLTPFSLPVGLCLSPEYKTRQAGDLEGGRGRHARAAPLWKGVLSR